MRSFACRLLLSHHPVDPVLMQSWPKKKHRSEDWETWSVPGSWHHWRACTSALFFSNLSHQQQDLSLQQIFSISHCDSWDAAGDLIPICGLLHKSFSILSLLIFTSWSPYALISERRGREKKAVAVSSKEKSVQVINYLCSVCCLSTVFRTIECCVLADTVSRVNWEVVHRKGIIEYRSSSSDGSQASGEKKSKRTLLSDPASRILEDQSPSDSSDIISTFII